MLQRRRFLHLSAGAALMSAAGPLRSGRAAAQDTLVDRALAAGEDRVVLASDTGAYMDVVYESFFDPFTEATGITVQVAGGSLAERVARTRAMNQAGNVEWDVLMLGISDALNPTLTPLLEDLGSCAALPNVVSNGLDGACVGPGVVFDVGGMVLTYDRRAFPDGGPQNWSDFWDVERFPGPRALPNYGRPWQVLAAALLADGVAPDALFPLDLDRAFRKLDALLPHITVWWTSGDQSQQLLRTQEVVASMMFSGRASQLHTEGLVGFGWHGAILSGGVLSVLRNAPRPNAAMALLDFVYTRPEAHAHFMAEMRYATMVRGANDRLDPAQRQTLATHPDNWPRIVRLDAAWLAENRDAVLERWTGWISG